MSKPIRSDASIERPVNTEQLQASTATIPTYAAVGDEVKHPNSSLIYFPPSDPFESEDKAEVPTESMAVSEPHQSDRGTVTLCYLNQKIQVLWPKEERNKLDSEAAKSSHIKETSYCYREDSIRGKKDSEI